MRFPVKSRDGSLRNGRWFQRGSSSTYNFANSKTYMIGAIVPCLRRSLHAHTGQTLDTRRLLQQILRGQGWCWRFANLPTCNPGTNTRSLNNGDVPERARIRRVAFIFWVSSSMPYLWCKNSRTLTVNIPTAWRLSITLSCRLPTHPP